MQMRFTVLDHSGSVSFLGPGHALKMLAAACSSEPADARALLDALASFDAKLARVVLDGLAVFDEHCVLDSAASFERWVQEHGLEGERPFRVMDERARQASLRSAPLGIVLFNLPARRIVQVQNSYAPLERRDRGRIRVDGRPVQRLYHYNLPESWAILP